MSKQQIYNYAIERINHEILFWTELSRGKSFIQRAFIGSKIWAFKKLRKEYKHKLDALEVQKDG